MKYSYQILYNKKGEFCGIFYGGDISNLFSKDLIIKTKKSSVEFKENKKTGRNNFLEIEQSLKIK